VGTLKGRRCEKWSLCQVVMLPTGFNAGCLGFREARNWKRTLVSAILKRSYQEISVCFSWSFRPFEKTEGRVWSNLGIAVTCESIWVGPLELLFWAKLEILYYSVFFSKKDITS
jgi:hypothetical protein